MSETNGLGTNTATDDERAISHAGDAQPVPDVDSAETDGWADDGLEDDDRDDGDRDDDDDNDGLSADDDRDNDGLSADDDDDDLSGDHSSDPAPRYDFGEAEERLLALQQKLREQKIPAVIVLEGWSAAGKGTMAGELIEGLDPRGYRVCVTERLQGEKKEYPPMRRFWTRMPEKGQISIFVGSWYDEICADIVKGRHGAKESLARAEMMERMLAADGVLLLKFFLDISKKEQKRRLHELESRKRGCARVTKADWRQNEHYDKWKKAYAVMRKNTDDERMEWHALPGESKRACKRMMYETIIAAFERVLAERAENDRSWDTPALPRHESVKTAPIPRLELFETQQAMEEDYKSALEAAQRKLKKLQYELFRKGVPMVIAFEGWDAAGKGGAIRRLTSALDARAFRVIPVASPTPEEKGHHHLWRFWTRVPAKGEVRIFDRTWYGRVMVERIEGFCTENQWRRAYEEINLFEKELADAGAVICKFWLQISNDEQLRRFQARQETPDKQWKLTDEDWRNREKWPEYAAAADDMLQKTNTACAPWTVVEADNKQYARIKVLHTVAAAMERALEGR